MSIRQLLSSVSGAAITAELQAYGFDVIQDDPMRDGTVRIKAVQAFVDQHRIVEGTPIVRTAPGTLTPHPAREDYTDVQFNSFAPTGWAFAPREAVTAEMAVTRLAERLRGGHAVTVTPESATLLDRAIASTELATLSGGQRLVLGVLAWFTTRTGRPVLVAIRPRRGVRTTIGWRLAGHLFARFPRQRVRWSSHR
ncbi:hypothetical protein [Methylorubrum sp. GM97]|uniref:hypothetical protein n=1 Tax=Methylorubrum sp. GM97 TaxID=2938232 RepID=UPI0021874781|nr:hypothetical protein [Methylorubrum sp. GM97]BDL38635.1 hypothetical protein MSPGM_12250 [Methylorubrum sp. GM97]